MEVSAAVECQLGAPVGDGTKNLVSADFDGTKQLCKNILDYWCF